jgi:hypothetical protein
MRYPIVHNQALGCGGMIRPAGPAVTRQASATQDFESAGKEKRELELGKALEELQASRDFVGRILSETQALSGALGDEKAKLAVLQAMDHLRHAENRVRTLGGSL